MALPVEVADALIGLFGAVVGWLAKLLHGVLTKAPK